MFRKAGVESARAVLGRTRTSVTERELGRRTRTGERGLWVACGGSIIRHHIGVVLITGIQLAAYPVCCCPSVHSPRLRKLDFKPMNAPYRPT